MSTHLTDHTDAPIYDAFSQIHRAVVQYSSTTTGEIKVVIPSVTGIYKSVPISYFGREAHPFENDWVVPNVGSSIIVCREDEDYKQVFWINTTYNPVRADIGEPNDDDQDNPTQYGFGPDGQIGSGAGFELMTVTPTSAGLYLSSTHMGYWTSAGSGAWRTYMDYFGNFYLTGSGNATHGLTWTASTNTLAITGNITIGNVSEVLGALGNPEANSSAQDNPVNYTFGAGMDMALVNLPATPTTAGLFLGANYLGFHSGSGGAWTTYMDATGKFYLGGTSGQLQWNGSTLLIHGSAAISGTVTVGGTAASTVASGAALGALAVQDGDGSLDLTLTDGAVGGWVITTGVLTGGTGSYKIELDQANRRISAGGGRAVMRVDSDARVVIGIDADAGNAPTYSNSGGDVVMERTAGGTPRFSCGNKLTWDGTTLSVTGTIVVGSTTLTESNTLNDNTTKSQVGLANVENLNAASIQAGTTAANVGLGNVANLDAEGQAVSGMAGAAVEITDGSIRAGQSAFNSGTGFFLGKASGDVPKFSVGSSSNYMAWDGSTLNIKGSLTIAGSSTTLTETNTLNTNTTKANVGLSNVDNDSTDTIRSEAAATSGYLCASGGWTINSDAIFSGTKDTSGYSSSGITLTTAGSLHSPQFYIDTSGNAFFKGTITASVFRTSESTSVPRLVINPTSYTGFGDAAFFQGYTGNNSEVYPGFLIFTEHNSTTSSVTLAAPRYSASFGYSGIIATHNTSGKGSIGMGTPGNADVFNISDTSGTLYTWIGSGNVGIGPDTSPNYKLDVQGTGRFDNDLSVGGTLTVAGTITGNLSGAVLGNVTGSSTSCTGNAATANTAGSATTATTATTANNVAVTLNASTNVNYAVPFLYLNGASAYIQRDASLSYNPNTNRFSASGYYAGTSSATSSPFQSTNTNTSYTGTMNQLWCYRTGSNDYFFARWWSGPSNAADSEYKFYGTGWAYADGGWGTPANDYAEYFEWEDGNPSDEDRRGICVTLVGNKIRPAVEGEEIVGVVSAVPGFVGGSQDGQWQDKYLRDDYRSYILEDVEMVRWATGEEGEEDADHSYPVDSVPEGVVVPDDAVQYTSAERIRNPDWDESLEYVARRERKEWSPIGMMGQLRVRKGQPTRSSWIKIQDISDAVEEWLVR